MRLTNSIRDAFIRSVMDDLPKVKDYKPELERLIMEDAVVQLPQEVKEVWNKPGLKDFINRIHINPISVFKFTKDLGSLRYSINSVAIPCKNNSSPHSYNTLSYNPSFDCRKRVKELLEEWVTENEKRDSAQKKLRAIAYGATTRKALVQALPEFEKYLPPEVSAAIDRSVPVISNVVSEFKELGWPKDSPAAQKPIQASLI